MTTDALQAGASGAARLDAVERYSRFERCYRRSICRGRRLSSSGFFADICRPTVGREISIIHHVNLDAIAQGGPDASVLCDLAGSVLTWKTVAERINLGQAEMQTQLELVERLISRFGAKSIVAFEGDDYQIAREGVVVMDLLAAEVDLATAAWAADQATWEFNHRFAERYGA